MFGERSTLLLALFSWNNLVYCRRLSVTNVDHWILSAFDKQTVGKLLSAINYSFDIEEVREHTIITHVYTINVIIIYNCDLILILIRLVSKTSEQFLIYKY